MNSVGNVAKVLRLFTPDRSVLSVTEVSQLLALPKSSTSRLLKAMAETGLLAATGQGAGYSVGHLIFETSRRHRAHATLSVIADEALAAVFMNPKIAPAFLRPTSRHRAQRLGCWNRMPP